MLLGIDPMNDASQAKEARGIWFVYDGDCPLCTSAAKALKIKQDYGKLYLVNARDSKRHRLVQAINKRGLDLDEGMVIYDGQRLYHGHKALNFMARYGDERSAFNLLNKLMFWFEWPAKLSYPWLRSVRNVLLRIRKKPPIDNLNLKESPAFSSVFGHGWAEMPAAIRKRYGNRAYTEDITTLSGAMDITCRWPYKLASPVLWLLGLMPAVNASNVSMTVHIESEINAKEFLVGRLVYLTTRKRRRCQSRLNLTGKNEVVETTRLGFGWRSAIFWRDDKVIYRHQDYVLSLAGHLISLPLVWLFGAIYVEESPVDGRHFDRVTRLEHRFLGVLYQCTGRFKILT